MANINCRLNALELKLDTVVDILQNKCPHKDSTATDVSNQDSTQGKRDGTGDDKGTGSKDSGNPTAHQGNTGRINVTFPNTTFNILSSRNHDGGTDGTGDNKEDRVAVASTGSTSGAVTAAAVSSAGVAASAVDKPTVTSKPATEKPSVVTCRNGKVVGITEERLKAVLTQFEEDSTDESVKDAVGNEGAAASTADAVAHNDKC